MQAILRNGWSSAVEAIPARSRALTPAAATCAALWAAAMLVASQDLSGAVVAPLIGAGLAMTAALLVVIQRQHTRLRNLAATDGLTGLVNHGGFHETLESELALARDRDQPLSLVLLDIDGFRAVNEAHGHPHGDRVLSAVGTALGEITRTSDTAARLGGEEFALILPGAESQTAFVIAERARASIRGVLVDGLELSSSAGIATFPTDAEGATNLCELADSALFWAKRSGKGRTRRFDPDHSPAILGGVQRAEIAAILERKPAIVPVFQPVASLASGRVIGYEALARFPSAGGRTPDVIFAQAHGCGLGAELEAAAIEAALQPGNRPPDSILAINVSPSALTSEVVREALRGADLERIVIEITEHEFVPDDGLLTSTLEELRDRGARIAIDDAGAGHAGLNQLMRVRPDIVKLDRDLIHDIDADPVRMALVESFIRFARKVGSTVCAEGIETMAELEVLADLDVQWGQGFALARPGKPWIGIAPDAAELCRATLAETFRAVPPSGHNGVSSDRRLVHLTAHLSGARTAQDLESALGLIAEELDASKVCLSAWHPAEATVVMLAENGQRSNETVFDIDEYPLTAHVLREQEAVQVIVGDPDADPSEVALLERLGARSLLMIPVVTRAETLGLIEAYRAADSPWSRVEINRARVIANQFAAVIGNFATTEAPPPVGETG